MSLIRNIMIILLPGIFIASCTPAFADCVNATGSCGLSMEFRAKITAETCTFAATSQTFPFGNVYPQQILDKQKVVTADIAVSSCTATPVNVGFYLTPVSGTTLGSDANNNSVLQPAGKNFGIQIEFGLVNPSGSPDMWGNLPYNATTPMRFVNAVMEGKKIRLVATLLPLKGKTLGSDFPAGSFTAAATLNINYF
jgi:type 1 fimbria pilin